MNVMFNICTFYSRKRIVLLYSIRDHDSTMFYHSPPSVYSGLSSHVNHTPHIHNFNSTRMFLLPQMDNIRNKRLIPRPSEDVPAPSEFFMSHFMTSLKS